MLPIEPPLRRNEMASLEQICDGRACGHGAEKRSAVLQHNRFDLAHKEGLTTPLRYTHCLVPENTQWTLVVHKRACLAKFFCLTCMAKQP